MNQECRNEDKTTNTGLARMFKGGVIMDVVNAEQARIAGRATARSWP